MFWNILRMENAKTLKRPFFWIELVIVLFFVVITDVVLFAARNSMPAGTNLNITWPAGLVNAFAQITPSQIGGIVLIVLVGALTTQEYSWRSMQLWLSHGVPRPQLLLAKFVQTLAPLFILILSAALVSSAVTAIFSTQLNGTLHLEQIDVWQIPLSALRSVYALFPYMALTYMLAVLTRSTLWAVAGGVVFAVIVEPLASALLGLAGETGVRISAYLPTGLAYNMFNQNYAISKVGITNVASNLNINLGGSTIPPSLMPAPLVAVIVIALYTVVFCGIALWAFQRQDLTN